MSPPTLPPCPATPNCVSSQADPTDAQHYLPPLPYQLDSARVIEVVRAVISKEPRHTIITVRPDYLKAELRTRVFRFVDELEFAVDEATRLLHFRSAARLGKYDFGVNRRRMRRLLGKLQARLNPAP